MAKGTELNIMNAKNPKMVNKMILKKVVKTTIFNLKQYTRTGPTLIEQ